MPTQAKSTAKYPIKSAEESLPLVLHAKEIVFADIETTGFGWYDDITEIGAVRVNIENGKILDKFSTFVHLKNHKKMPAKIVNLTGITDDDVLDAPQLETVLMAFQKFIGNSVLSFHNAMFDWRMLQQKYSLIGRQLSNDVICTVKLFRYLHPGLPSNLEDVTSYYGTPIEGHHRAYVDCKWTAACYLKMRQELMFLQEKQQISLLQPPSILPTVKEIGLDDLRKDCLVYRISGWKKGQRNRIYITTNMVDFYYDVNEHVWNVSKNKMQANFTTDSLATFILERVNMPLFKFIETYSLR